MNIGTKQIIETVGLIAVVGSLLFVGMQLRLESRVALSEQYANRAETLMANNRAKLESEAWMSAADKLWESGWRYPWWNETLEEEYAKYGYSGSEIEAEVLNASMTIMHIDNLYFQYQQGLLNETFWRNGKAALRRTLADEESINAYVFRANQILPIQELIEELDGLSTN